MRTILISMILASGTPLVFAQATLQLLVKQLASPNASRPFGDVGRFDIRAGNTSSSDGECPGNTNATGKIICRFACKPEDQTTRNFKIVPPRNERTRLFTAPAAKEVSLQGCQLSLAELEFVYVDAAYALRDLTKDTPLATQFANAGAANWDGKFDASSPAWVQLSASQSGRQKLDQIRSITGEMALDKISAKDTQSAVKWDNFSVGISNILLKESAQRNYGNDTATKITVSPNKADFYKNLRVVEQHIEAKDVMTPVDTRRLNEVKKLGGTTSDKLPSASFKSIAID